MFVDTFFSRSPVDLCKAALFFPGSPLGRRATAVPVIITYIPLSTYVGMPSYPFWQPRPVPVRGLVKGWGGEVYLCSPAWRRATFSPGIDICCIFCPVPSVPNMERFSHALPFAPPLPEKKDSVVATLFLETYP